MRTSSTTNKIEWGLAAFCLISIGLRTLSASIFDSIFVFAAFSLILYYSLRMYLGFKHWQKEKWLAVASTLLFLGLVALLVSWTMLLLFRPESDEVLEMVLIGSSILILGVGIFYVLIRKTIQPTYLKAWAKGHMARWAMFLPLILITYLIGWQGIFRTFYPEQYNQPQPFTSYHQNGAKQAEGFYLNGKPDSTWVYYDQMGDTTEVIENGE